MNRLKLAVGAVCAIAIAVIILTAATGGSITGLFSGKSTAGGEKVVLADIPVIGYGAAYVALKKGFFQNEGLDVQVETFTAGSTSLNALFAGRVDAAMVGDFPAVLSAFKTKDFVITGTLSENEYEMVARKDRNITGFADLKGKTVAVKTGTGPQFDFYKVLSMEGINKSEVTVKEVDPTLMPLALEKGDVDAIFVWPPFDFVASSALGDNAGVFSLAGVYNTTLVVVFRRDFVEQHPQAVEKFMRALVDAEKFIKENPAEAIGIVSERTGVKENDLKQMWDRQKFEVLLDEKLLNNLNDQAAFAKSAALVKTNESIPDFCSMVYPKALQDIDNSRVTIAC